MEGRFDVEVLLAVRNFIDLGLHPGSCAVALILRNVDGAMRAAHPLLQPHIETMAKVVSDILPPDIFNTEKDVTEWEAHQGLGGASDHMNVLFKLHGWERLEVPLTFTETHEAALIALQRSLRIQQTLTSQRREALQASPVPRYDAD